MSATTSKEFLAARGYDYDGVVVDVYAVDGEEGWEMSAVKLAGDDRNLLPLLGASEFRHFDAMVDRLWLAERRAEYKNRQVGILHGLLMGAPM